MQDVQELVVFLERFVAILPRKKRKPFHSDDIIRFFRRNITLMEKQEVIVFFSQFCEEIELEISFDKHNGCLEDVKRLVEEVKTLSEIQTILNKELDRRKEADLVSIAREYEIDKALRDRDALIASLRRQVAELTGLARDIQSSNVRPDFSELVTAVSLLSLLIIRLPIPFKFVYALNQVVGKLFTSIARLERG